MVRNGEISPSAEITPESKRRKRIGAANTTTGAHNYIRKQYAETETLVTYFSEDWFDFDNIIEEESRLADRKSKEMNSVFRCDFCLKPWSKGDRQGEIEYFDVNIFKNIPMEKKTCLECESVLPADIE
jgi:RNA polymerase subunit RPABC4/transcription elongation factor Spt4